MAITFPNSPSSGDTHTTSNGLQYTYDGEKWTTIGTNSAGTWTRTGTTVSLTTAGDDLNVDSGTLFVDASTNNVGVGTTSPGSYSAYANNLVVNEAGNAGISISSTDSGSNVSSIQFTGGTTRRHYIECTNGSNGNFTFQTGGTGAFRFIDGSGERVRIDGSGHMQIGSTTSDSFRLKVLNGAGTLARFTDGTSQTLDIRQASGGIELQNPNNGFISFKGSSAERMRIDSAGRLLVGASSSSQVNTAVFQGNSAAGSGPGVILASSINNPSSTQVLGKLAFSDNGHVDAASIKAARDQGTWTSGSSQPSSLAFFTTADGASSPTERLRIDSSGRLLLGTTTAGTTAADDLTVSTSGDTGITIRSGTSNSGSLMFADGTSGSASYRAQISYYHSSDHMAFNTNGGFERMRIQSGGGISFNGDTATANALDDYEEGTWTPGAANNSTGSVSNSTGKYVKIGKLVFCTINFSGSGFGGSNVVSISGLPFTHGGTSNDPAFSFNDCGHTIGIGNSANNPRLRMDGSYLQGVESLGSTTYLTWTELGGGSGTLEFRGSFTYTTF